MSRYLLPLFLLAALACHKDAPAPALTTTITLAEPVIKDDTTAVFTWSLLNNPDFKNYYVVRKEDPAEQGYRVYTSITVGTSTFTDQQVPYNDYVQYQVLGELTSGQIIESNIVTYRRPQIKALTAGIFHVLFEDQSRTLLFFSDSGELIQYDVASGQPRKTASLGPVGYASFGMYKGVKELYVPRTDGSILIFNAATLEKIEEITTGGSFLTDVLASNGLLYVSSRYSSPISQLAVFSRASKQLVTTTGVVAYSSLRLYTEPTLPNAFIGVTLDVGPTDQALYQFSAAGRFQSVTPDKYHGDHPLDGLLFSFFPAGDRYLTGEKGGIYTHTMTYLASLDQGKISFTCFGFDAAAGTVYAGTTKRLVKVYSLADYSPVRQLKTILYPFKLFKDPAGGFVSLGLRNPVENYFYSKPYAPARVYLTHLD